MLWFINTTWGKSGKGVKMFKNFWAGLLSVGGWIFWSTRQWSLRSHVVSVCPSVRPHFSKTRKTSPSENSDRYWRDCGSGQVDHWWHAYLFSLFILKKPLFYSSINLKRVSLVIKAPEMSWHLFDIWNQAYAHAQFQYYISANCVHLLRFFRHMSFRFRSLNYTWNSLLGVHRTQRAVLVVNKRNVTKKFKTYPQLFTMRCGQSKKRQ